MASSLAAAPPARTGSWNRLLRRPAGLAFLYRFLYSYSMTLLDDVHEVSVTEAAQRGVAGLVADAERGANLVVTRRNRPVAYVVSVDRLAELDRVAEDLIDLVLVLARSATDSGSRIPLDDVLAAFGHTRESLAALPDDEEIPSDQ